MLVTGTSPATRKVCEVNLPGTNEVIGGRSLAASRPPHEDNNSNNSCHPKPRIPTAAAMRDATPLLVTTSPKSDLSGNLGISIEHGGPILQSVRSSHYLTPRNL